jgi:branched-chain amino acid transport system ATP-binding protein
LETKNWETENRATHVPTHLPTPVPPLGPLPASAAAKPEVILHMQDVVAGYGQMMILKGTTASINRAAITTVIGPNGAGKSTVFKTIFGLLAVRSGSITYGGQEISNKKPRDLLAMGITYVPQGRNIFPELSVLHNLELGGISAPSSVNMKERIEVVLQRFPMLREKAHQQASTLSGGQQKTLEIARALLLDPQMMLIDEPSIGLSPLMVKDLFAVLHELRAKGVTILMVEQNARSALAMSDYGLVLVQGATTMERPASDLLADPAVGQMFLGIKH